MNASLLSIRADGEIAAAGDGLVAHPWRHAVVANLPFAVVFAVLWGLTYLPAVAWEGQRGVSLFVATFFQPLLTMALLASLLAWLDVRWPQHRWRFVALTAAAVIAACLGMTVDVLVLASSGIWAQPSNSLPVIWWGNFGGSLATCLVAAYTLDSRTRARRRADALADLRRQRALVLRRTVEARLQATQARVDPQFLFEVLAAVERLREASPPDGDRLLDDLIAYLRAALPDVEAASTTLGGELALARAWLDIQRVLRGGRLQCTLDVPDTQHAIPFPPMTLVPLLEAAIACAGPSDPVSLTLDADSTDAGLRVRVRSSVPIAAEGRGMGELRTRLAELYGQAARVVILNGEAPSGELALELPDDHAESRPR